MILTLLVLDLRLDHNRNFLYLLPLFQLFWVNIEGLFILGWVVLGAYLLTAGFISNASTGPGEMVAGFRRGLLYKPLFP